MAGRLNDGCGYDLRSTRLGSTQELLNLSDSALEADFARTKSDTTTANVTLGKSGGGPECCEVIAGLRTVYQELSIMRGGTIVWQGPIAQLTETRGEMKIKAYDRSIWFRGWATTREAFSQSGQDLGVIFAAYLDNVLSGGAELGVTIPAPFISGVTGDRSAEVGKALASTLVDELAKSGVPWTMIADVLMVGSQADVEAVALTDWDIVGDVALIEDGEAWGTTVYQAGDASVLRVSGGPVLGVSKDVIASDSTVKDEDSAQAAADTKWARLGGDSPPVVLSVPTGSTLSPEAPVTFDQLIPGRTFTMDLSESWCRRELIVPTVELADVKVAIGKSSGSSIDTESVQVSFTNKGLGATFGGPSGHAISRVFPVSAPPQFVPPPAPVLTSVAPTGGPTTGLTPLVLTGTGFRVGASVKIGGRNATTVSVNSETSISCYSPTGIAGAVDVRVVNPDGQSDVLEDVWTYTFVGPPPPSPPSVVSVSPTHAPTTGGGTITINGLHFAIGAGVHFGLVTATNVTVVSSSRITCRIPPHTAGPVDVIVTNPNGDIGTLTNGFTYSVVVAPAPQLLAVSPTTATDTGGILVTLNGANFVNGAVVRFDTTPASSVVVQTSGIITCVLPAHADGIVNVTVQNPDGQASTLASAFEFTPAIGPPPPPGPFTLVGLNPSSGPDTGGTSITLSGTGFATGTLVYIGGVQCPFVSVVDATTLIATAPPGPDLIVSVTAIHPDGRTATLTGAFTYQPVPPPPPPDPPTVTGVSPSSGVNTGGTVITVTGTLFQAGATVTIGGVLCTAVTVLTATSLRATTAAGSNGGKTVRVTNPDGSFGELISGFTYVSATLPAPTISSVSPTSGSDSGGTVITVTGANFQTGATLRVGGVACTAVTRLSSTSIRGTTPAGIAGLKTVRVTNPDGQFVDRLNAFTYLASAWSSKFPGDIKPGWLRWGATNCGTNSLDSLEAGGKHCGVNRMYFGTIDAAGALTVCTRDVAKNTIPWVSFKPGSFTWAQIGAGAADAQIDAVINNLKSLAPAPIWLTFHHEPDNDFATTGNFTVAAWVAAQQRWRARLTALNAGAAQGGNIAFAPVYMPFSLTSGATGAHVMTEAWHIPGCWDFLGWDPYAISTTACYTSFNDSRLAEPSGWNDLRTWSTSHGLPFALGEWASRQISGQCAVDFYNNNYDIWLSTVGTGNGAGQCIGVAYFNCSAGSVSDVMVDPGLTAWRALTARSTSLLANQVGT